MKTTTKKHASTADQSNATENAMKTTKSHASTDQSNATQNLTENAMKTTTKKHASTANQSNATENAMKAAEITNATKQATTAIPETTPATSTNPKVKPLFVPTEEQITSLVGLLEGVRTLLADSAVELTAAERRRALRARKGGESTIGLMSGLGLQYKVQLPGIDPEQIQRYGQLVTRLQPLDTKLRVIASLVSDTLANAKTESWQGTTALYTALSRASTRNAALQRELKPAVAFFKAATPAAKASKSEKSSRKTAAAVIAAASAATPAESAPVAVAASATPAIAAPPMTAVAAAEPATKQ